MSIHSLGGSPILERRHWRRVFVCALWTRPQVFVSHGENILSARQSLRDSIRELHRGQYTAQMAMIRLVCDTNAPQIYTQNEKNDDDRANDQQALV
jgi:hypothetical protein